ncbi:MAG: pyrroline-5-carboxylate reductase [Lachnospiraceae bacterium]|nr:pyrroline-5-carboxylate reductase [Lachnospiraceae bacterium]
MYKYGFIGMGNMGSAMLSGLVKRYGSENVTFHEPNAAKQAETAEKYGVTPQENNEDVVTNSEFIILAVKPIVYDAVLKQIAPVLDYSKIVISIAPGITMEDVAKKVGKDVRVVRAMPNTPAMVGEGMTGVCYDPNEFNDNEMKDIERYFNAFGKFNIIDEHLMSAVTCASGSSPAYVYMFIEALADSVVKCGMPRAAAYEFVAQTVLGSAKMVLETGEHPGKLKDNVCSPGGTTIAAVEALEENGFRNSLFKATDKCYRKCEHLD